MIGIFMAHRSAFFKPGPDRDGVEEQFQYMCHFGPKLCQAFVEYFSDIIGQGKPDPPGPDQALAEPVAANQEGKVEKITSDPAKIVGRRQKGHVAA
jgi:hypothetical protein